MVLSSKHNQHLGSLILLLLIYVCTLIPIIGTKVLFVIHWLSKFLSWFLFFFPAKGPQAYMIVLISEEPLHSSGKKALNLGGRNTLVTLNRTKNHY